MSKREPFIMLSQLAYYRPKLGRLTPVERDAYVCSLTVAGMTNQDGEFSAYTVEQLTGTPLEGLQALIPSLWEPTGDPDVFVIHDWLDWNQSREQREMAVEYGRVGGIKSGEARRKKPVRTPPFDEPLKGETNPPLQKTLEGVVDPPPSENPSSLKRIKKKKNLSSPLSECLAEAEGKGGMGGKQKPAPSADCVSGNRAAKLPASWQPTEKHTQLAEELNLDLAAAVDVFKTWADGKRQKNWNLTFTNGLKSWIQSRLAQQLEARQRMNRVLATRPIPPDWWPNPQGVNLAGMSQENLGRAVGVFRDYHAAKGNVRADWDAQWRKDLNWVRDAAGHAQSGRGGIDWDEAERELQAVLAPQQAAGGTETGFRDAFTPTPVEVYAEPEKPPQNGLNGNDYSTDGVLFTDPPS